MDFGWFAISVLGMFGILVFVIFTIQWLRTPKDVVIVRLIFFCGMLAGLFIIAADLMYTNWVFYCAWNEAECAAREAGQNGPPPDTLPGTSPDTPPDSSGDPTPSETGGD